MCSPLGTWSGSISAGPPLQRWAFVDRMLPGPILSANEENVFLRLLAFRS